MMQSAKESNRSRVGRDARVRARKEAVPDRLPAMERGLPYIDLLNEEQLLRLHDYSVSILEQVGIEFRDDESLNFWRKAGANVTGQRVRIARALLMELVAKAPESYVLHARNPKHTVSVGGRKTIFTPAYGAPYVLDLDNQRRNATIDDFQNFAKTRP